MKISLHRSSISSSQSFQVLASNRQKKLYEYGFRSIPEIVNASMSQLTAVPGLGKATATKIKAFQLDSIEQ
ncbi:helix-hairpin-helix domain-containing protein [Aeromonas veronii]|uniref:helix-hairpin-helix domain-containing protein n=1 Tax=Aeromonas veronii TaxID=654 RepID=UPI003C702B4D